MATQQSVSPESGRSERPTETPDPFQDGAPRPEPGAASPATPAPVPIWERAAFLGILLTAALLRLWHLTQNGYGNTYYAAAVRSMLTSWHNFFFISFDPGGYVSIDKPPVALWLQALSAKVFGYSGFSLLLPQALAGVAAVALVYLLVRRVFGGGAGLVAALTLAVTPISVAIDRSNNLDSILVLFLLLAAWALLRAAETGRLRLLLRCAAPLGVAFKVKMLAAFVVLPTFALLYLLSAPIRPGKRVLNLVGAGLILATVSLSWAAVVDAVPRSQRPYVGSSQDNSAISLTIGYNGVGRVFGGEGNFPGGRRGFGRRGGQGAFPMPPGGMDGGGMPVPQGGMPGSGFPAPPGGMGSGFRPGGPMGGMPGFGGTPGPFRLMNWELSGQIVWLYPLALAGMIATFRPGRLRLPLTPRAQQFLLWGGWLLTYSVVYSLARGIFHPYYLVTLAPPLAALVGISAMTLWTDYRKGGWLLPFALLFTAGWQARVLTYFPDWSRTLLPILLGATLFAAITLILARLPETHPQRWRRVGLATLGLGLTAMLLCPTVWALTPVLAKGNSMIPSAGPHLMNGGGNFGPGMMGRMGNIDAKDAADMVAFLRANRKGERYLFMTPDLHFAAPIIIHTAEPVMALGGFIGADPILTVERFAQMVKEKQVRYVLLSPMGRMRGGKNGDIVRWVRENGTLVDSSLWNPKFEPVEMPDVSDLPMPPDAGGGGFPMPPMGGMGGGGFPMPPMGGIGGGFLGFMQLYDCAPGRDTSRAKPQGG